MVTGERDAARTELAESEAGRRQIVDDLRAAEQDRATAQAGAIRHEATAAAVDRAQASEARADRLHA